MTRLALIDGDILVYKKAFAAEEKSDFGDGRSVDKKKAEREINGHINDLADLVNADEVLVCLSDDSRNWRKEYWSGYKRDRDPSRRPVLWEHVRNFIQAEWPTKIVPALEADDVIGICATSPRFRPDAEKIIVSEDKDLLSIPGKQFNPAKDQKIRVVSELEADRWFLYQTLIGDPVDSYPGARGIGPKSRFARSILSANSVHEAWNLCVAGYRSKEPDKCDEMAARKALFQARLARILRHGDYDYKNKRPKLWTPDDPNRPWISRNTVGIPPEVPSD